MENNFDDSSPRPVFVDIIDNKPLKLDLACGQNIVSPDFEGVDLFAPLARFKVDLLKFPWPWADDSVEEIHCSHFVEHIPMCYWNDNGEYTFTGAQYNEMFFKFFRECWRILKPLSKMVVKVPYLQNMRAFQDPTHRRFLCETSFIYLDAEWRKAVGLDHYVSDLDFVAECDKITSPYEGVFNPETQAYRQHHMWNTVIDLNVKLTKRVAQ